MVVEILMEVEWQVTEGHGHRDEDRKAAMSGARWVLARLRLPLLEPYHSRWVKSQGHPWT